MQQLTNPGDIITGSWENFTRNFRGYAGFGVWYLLIAVVQWGLIVVCRAMFADIVSRNIALTVASIPTGLAATVLFIAMVHATSQGLQNKPFAPHESFVVGMHRLIPFIWVLALTMGAYLLGIAAFSIPMFATGSWLWLFLCFVPVFLLAVWFWFAPLFLIVDDVRGTRALSASRNATRGRWWDVAVRLLLPSIFYSVLASFVSQVVFLVIGALLGDPSTFTDQFKITDAATNSELLILTVVPAMLNAMALPLLYGCYLLLWMDLKRTRGQS